MGVSVHVRVGLILRSRLTMALWGPVFGLGGH